MERPAPIRSTWVTLRVGALHNAEPHAKEPENATPAMTSADWGWTAAMPPLWKADIGAASRRSFLRPPGAPVPEIAGDNSAPSECQTCHAIPRPGLQ